MPRTKGRGRAARSTPPAARVVRRQEPVLVQKWLRQAGPWEAYAWPCSTGEVELRLIKQGVPEGDEGWARAVDEGEWLEWHATIPQARELARRLLRMADAAERMLAAERDAAQRLLVEAQASR
jgi:hypothetical protein